MRCGTLLISALCVIMVSAQTYGNGLGKTTYSVSDAIGCSQWILSLLPAVPDHPNGPQGCGQVGRLRIATSAMQDGQCWMKKGTASLLPREPEAASYPSIAVLSSGGDGTCKYTIGDDVVGSGGQGTMVAAATPMDCCAACAAASDCNGASWVASQPGGFSQGFGLHTVHVNNSESRPFGDLSNKDVERALDAKMAAVYAGGAYDAFLDFTSGHWVSSLDSYTKTFDAVGIPYVKLAWKDALNGNAQYYSIIVRVHTSMMLIELQSEVCAACAKSALEYPHSRYHFKAGETPQSVFGSLTDKDAARPLMHPSRVGWPTSDLERDRKLFVDKKLVQVISSEQSYDVYDFTPFNAKATMQFHLVQSSANSTTGSLTIADWEDAMLACHEAVLRDDVCGFDQWLDNHIGLSSRSSNPGNWDVGTLVNVLNGLKLRYHTLDNNGNHAVYLSAPNGLTVQVSGMSIGSYVPTRPQGGSSVNLCGNGTCA